jgi:hypothetical protein
MKLFPWLLVAIGTPLLFTACASISPPEPPSLELPKPPADLRAARKGGKVTLTWTVPATTTDRQPLRSFGATRICRGLDVALTECGKAIGEAGPPASRVAAQKVTGAFVDTLAKTVENDHTGFLTYAVEVLNAGGRGGGLSNQVRVTRAPTLPPPQDFRAEVTSQGVVLSWTAQGQPVASPALRYVYRVFRREEGNPQQVLVGEMPLGSERNFTVTDTSIEWQKTYEYRAAAVTIVAEENKPEIQIEGDDTPEIRVFANDVFPPAVPSALQAVFSGPGQTPFIDLIWAPVTDVDLDGYNVYRREEGGGPAVKLNAEPVRAPAYRDTTVMPGKHYLYSVSAVDVRRNESGRSEEAGESTP